MSHLFDRGQRIQASLHHVILYMTKLAEPLIGVIFRYLSKRARSATPPSPLLAPPSELEGLLSVHQRRPDRFGEDTNDRKETSALGITVQPGFGGGLPLAELTKKWEPEVTMDDIAVEEAAQAERERRDAEGWEEGFGRFEVAPSDSAKNNEEGVI